MQIVAASSTMHKSREEICEWTFLPNDVTALFEIDSGAELLQCRSEGNRSFVESVFSKRDSKEITEWKEKANFKEAICWARWNGILTSWLWSELHSRSSQAKPTTKQKLYECCSRL